jgi:hypothetical protein
LLLPACGSISGEAKRTFGTALVRNELIESPGSPDGGNSSVEIRTAFVINDV